jgi:CrcB protein
MIVAAGFLVAAAAGSAGRALAFHALDRGHHLPLGTLVVNVTGSFVLGAISSLERPWLTVVGTGALGAYTTFSTFAGEVVRLRDEHRSRLAVTYLVVMLAACVGAAWLGLLVS